MHFMMACTSHSPLLYFAARESDELLAIREELAAERKRIEKFDPELVILFGNDHYGGHQMHAMPAFCVGVEATALADVGGTPGRLNVPRDLAIEAVSAFREGGIDVAVSYAMDVDHGFSQVLEMLTGGIDTYPVLPLFVQCIQPPFVPFKRARIFGEVVARFAATLPFKRILFIGTGGLSHNPELLFPPIDTVSEEWRPYHLLGKRQSGVSQQSWIDYQIAAHHMGAELLTDDNVPIEAYGIKDSWDKDFLSIFTSGEFETFDDWTATQVLQDTGIGSMEILSWIAAGQAMKTATGARSQVRLQTPCREIGVGFGIVETPPSPATIRTPAFA